MIGQSRPMTDAAKDQVLAELVERNGIDPALIDDVVGGCVRAGDAFVAVMGCRRR